MIQLRKVLVHPGIVNSARVNALPVTVQLFFHRLLHACDGAGRFLADPAELRLALYGRSPGVQSSHLQVWLQKIHQAGLVRLYTSGGMGYGEVFNYRQRDTGIPARYPHETDELDFFGEEAAGTSLRLRRPDPVEAQLPATPEPNTNTKEEKRRKTKDATRVASSLSLSQNLESDEEFVERLTQAYPDLDLAQQEQACRKYCQRHGKVFERGYFERWLAIATPPIARPLFTPKKAQQTPSAEPDGWRSVISDTQYGPGGAFEAKSWADLPADVQAFVVSELRKAA